MISSSTNINKPINPAGSKKLHMKSYPGEVKTPATIIAP
jgi:hypothetical protein